MSGHFILEVRTGEIVEGVEKGSPLGDISCDLVFRIINGLDLTLIHFLKSLIDLYAKCHNCLSLK